MRLYILLTTLLAMAACRQVQSPDDVQEGPHYYDCPEKHFYEVKYAYMDDLHIVCRIKIDQDSDMQKIIKYKPLNWQVHEMKLDYHGTDTLLLQQLLKQFPELDSLTMHMSSRAEAVPTNLFALLPNLKYFNYTGKAIEFDTTVFKHDTALQEFIMYCTRPYQYKQFFQVDHSTGLLEEDTAGNAQSEQTRLLDSAKFDRQSRYILKALACAPHLDRVTLHGFSYPGSLKEFYALKQVSYLHLYIDDINLFNCDSLAQMPRLKELAVGNCNEQDLPPCLKGNKRINIILN